MSFMVLNLESLFLGDSSTLPSIRAKRAILKGIELVPEVLQSISPLGSNHYGQARPRVKD